MSENRQIVIATLPAGRLQPGDFAIRTESIPEPADGQVLCRTLAFTIGAGQRAGLQGSASYAGAPQTGVVMGGTGFARVEASNAADVEVGSLVVAPTGWQEYSVHDANAVSPAPHEDPARSLGVLGTNGLTA